MKYRFEICFIPSKGSKIRTVSKEQYDTAKIALSEAYVKIVGMLNDFPNKDNYEITINLKMI